MCTAACDGYLVCAVLLSSAALFFAAMAAVASHLTVRFLSPCAFAADACASFFATSASAALVGEGAAFVLNRRSNSGITGWYRVGLEQRCAENEGQVSTSPSDSCGGDRSERGLVTGQEGQAK